MNRLLGSIREVLVITSERRKPGQYRAWVHYLNKVVSEKLLPLFCSMKDSIDEPTRRALLKQACDILGEVEPTLGSGDGPAHVPEGAGESYVTSAKQGLLELWHHLLESLERVPGSEVSPVVFAVLLAVLRRPEFDLGHLHLDVHNKPTCAPHDVMLAFRYRRLMFATLAYIARILGTAAAADAAASVSAASPAPAASPSTSAAAAAPPASPDASTSARPKRLRRARRGGLEARVESETSTSAAAGADDEELEVLDVPTRSEEEALKSIELPATEHKPEDAAAATPAAAEAEAEPAKEASVVTTPPPPELEVAEHRPVVVDEVAAAESGSAPAAEKAAAEATRDTSPAATSPSPQPRKARPPPRSSLGLSASFTSFAAKALAVLYFRLPCIQEDMRRAAIAPDEPGGAVPPPLPTAASAASSTPPNPDVFPMLLRWAQYHDTVRRWNKDDEEEKYLRSTKEWLVHISRRGDLFLEFFTEWLSHINQVVQGRSGFEWGGLTGYQEFSRAFFCLYSYLAQEQLPQRTLSACETLLLPTDHPNVINTLIRVGYARTSARDINAVIAMLLAIENWLAEISRCRLVLGDGFDAQHFCEGLDIILRSDHHLIIAKLLAIIYATGDLFQGNSRVVLFGDLLLKKHFFHLFLHWDENVRNIFCQVLCFKMLQSKRRALALGADKKSRRKLDPKRPEDKSSPQSIDMLMLVKIEAYVRIVADYIDGVRAGRIRPAGMSSGGDTFGIRTARKKKTFIIEDPPPPPSAVESPSPASPSPTHSPTPSSSSSTPPPATAAAADAAPVTSLDLLPEPTPDSLPSHLTVYAERAFDDYHKHMMRYNEWQTRSSAEAPRLLTLQ